MSNLVNPPPATISTKVASSLLFTKAIFAALTRLCTSPFKGQNRHPKYLKDVVFAAMRTQLRGMTTAQARLLQKTSTEAYHDFVKAEKSVPQSIHLPNGVQAHWVGDKDAATTIVYFHGGGYSLPASKPHYIYLNHLITAMNQAGASVSALVLAYTLAPEAEYPTQLIEAATLIQHLLETDNRSPSSLILGGDSAGGNLLLSLLSHTLHPHSNPAIPTLHLHEPFHATFLLSPWVSFATDHPSYVKNAESDMFDAIPLNAWAKAFLGSNRRQGILMGDSYSEPLLAEPSWWSDAPNVVKEVLIWGGGGEVLIDGIKAFADKFEQGWVNGGGDRNNIKLVVTPRNAHEEMIVDVILGFKTKGDGALAVEAWAKSKL